MINIIDRLYLNMDSIPNELIQSIFDISSTNTNIVLDSNHQTLDYSDMMSRIMLSMTCKRINAIYNSNNYITKKKIQVSLSIKPITKSPTKSLTNNIKHRIYYIDITLCNTLSDIVKKVKRITRIYDNSISIDFEIQMLTKYISYNNDSYAIRKVIFTPSNILFESNPICGNTPIGYSNNIFDDINYISVRHNQ